MAKENPFTEGQVVQLKSGGPKMTIDSFFEDEDNGKTYAVCVWQVGNKSFTDEFSITSLKIVNDGPLLPDMK